jgi:2-aminoadipate transaminase
VKNHKTHCYAYKEKPMNIDALLAKRTRNMETNAIREILKVVSRPGMVSLAGGIPAPDSFPMAIIGDLTAAVIARYGSGAFQYDATEGFGPLREALSGYLASLDVTAAPGEILVASGSQGVLDALGKVLISRGDDVAVEAPTYLGALSAFNPYGPTYLRMDTDENGLVPESLEEILRHHSVKFVYLVPNFQNPTGRTLPLKRRRQIARILQENDALLVEDDPYRALRYQGKDLPPIHSMAPDNVIYVGTLSKVFAPGLRIGFCVAPSPIRRWLVRVKQGVDLHTGTFSQALAAEYITSGSLGRHLPRILDLYRPRRQAMLRALQDHFPPGFAWSRPEGGMFLWVSGPAGMDMETLYEPCVRRNTAFVPGKYFYTERGEGVETMRLNFTMANGNAIERAIATMAEVIRKGV